MRAHVYLWKEDPQQQACHNLVVVSQPDEESVGATSGVNHLNQVQALPAKNKDDNFRFYNLKKFTNFGKKMESVAISHVKHSASLKQNVKQNILVLITANEYEKTEKLRVQQYFLQLVSYLFI